MPTIEKRDVGHILKRVYGRLRGRSRPLVRQKIQAAARERGVHRSPRVTAIARNLRREAMPKRYKIPERREPITRMQSRARSHAARVFSGLSRRYSRARRGFRGGFQLRDLGKPSGRDRRIRQTVTGGVRG